MITHHYELGSKVFKVNEDLVLWRTENGIVEVRKDTLAVEIVEDEKTKGFIFQGKGRLVLDTIVETEKGAFGKPTEKEIQQPFMLLGDAEQVRQHLREAGDNDQEFMEKSREILNRFFGKPLFHCGHVDCHDCFVFAFTSDKDRLDMLIVDSSNFCTKPLICSSWQTRIRCS